MILLDMKVVQMIPVYCIGNKFKWAGKKLKKSFCLKPQGLEPLNNYGHRLKHHQVDLN